MFFCLLATPVRIQTHYLETSMLLAHQGGSVVPASGCSAGFDTQLCQFSACIPKMRITRGPALESHQEFQMIGCSSSA